MILAICDPIRSDPIRFDCKKRVRNRITNSVSYIDVHIRGNSVYYFTQLAHGVYINKRTPSSRLCQPRSRATLFKPTASSTAGVIEPVYQEVSLISLGRHYKSSFDEVHSPTRKRDWREQRRPSCC